MIRFSGPACVSIYSHVIGVRISDSHLGLMKHAVYRGPNLAHLKSAMSRSREESERAIRQEARAGQRRRWDSITCADIPPSAFSFVLFDLEDLSQRVAPPISRFSFSFPFLTNLSNLHALLKTSSHDS